MTPAIIQARLLKARQDELRRIVEEIKAYPPVNAIELLQACKAVQEDIAAECRRLHEDRAAVSSR